MRHKHVPKFGTHKSNLLVKTGHTHHTKNASGRIIGGPLNVNARRSDKLQTFRNACLILEQLYLLDCCRARRLNVSYTRKPNPAYLWFILRRLNLQLVYWGTRYSILNVFLCGLSNWKGNLSIDTMPRYPRRNNKKTFVITARLKDFPVQPGSQLEFYFQ